MPPSCIKCSTQRENLVENVSHFCIYSNRTGLDFNKYKKIWTKVEYSDFFSGANQIFGTLMHQECVYISVGRRCDRASLFRGCFLSKSICIKLESPWISPLCVAALLFWLSGHTLDQVFLFEDSLFGSRLNLLWKKTPQAMKRDTPGDICGLCLFWISHVKRVCSFWQHLRHRSCIFV